MIGKRPSKEVEIGSTTDAYRFGKEVEFQIGKMFEKGLAFIQPRFPSEIQSLYEAYIGLGAPVIGSCRTVLLTSLHQCNKGNQHHWIVIDSTGFHSKFYDLVRAKKGRRNASALFINYYFAFVASSALIWAKTFHLHFIKADQVKSNLDFWIGYIIEDHSYNYHPGDKKGSDMSFMKSATPHLWEIEHNTFPRVGFKPINPSKLYYDCQKLIRNPAKMNTPRS